MTEPRTCLDCGTPTTGDRCRKHHGAWLRIQAAREFEARDREMLRQVAEEGLTPARLAVRHGWSRQYAALQIKKARARQTLLVEMA